MTRAEAQRLDKLSKLPPKAWEAKIAAALKANDWSYFHDKDRPTHNKRVVASRMPGHLDFEGWKKFEGYPPKPLMKAIGNYKANWTPRVYIECKTGAGVMDDKQQEFFDAVNDNPGCVAILAYPYDYYKVIELLGGKFPEEDDNVVDIRRKK